MDKFISLSTSNKKKKKKMERTSVNKVKKAGWSNRPNFRCFFIWFIECAEEQTLENL